MMNDHSIPHLHSASAPRVCPFAAKHGYCAPQKGDSRSVCPALNTMANHGYSPRNGDDVSLLDLICALQECYGLTWPLAAFLAIGGYVLLRWWPWRVFRLEEIGKHGAVEHDASLVHEDARGRLLAPTRIHPHLVTALADETLAAYAEDSHESRDGVVWTSYHAARARVRREKESPPLDAVHAEIARGEIAIMLCVWEYALVEVGTSSQASLSGEQDHNDMSGDLTRALEAHARLATFVRSPACAPALALHPSQSSTDDDFASNGASPVHMSFADAINAKGHARLCSVGNGSILTAGTSSLESHTRAGSAEPESTAQPEPTKVNAKATLNLSVTPIGNFRVSTHQQPCDELRGIPLAWWLKFLAEERLPEGVVEHGVRRRVGILDVVRKSAEIRSGMEYIRQVRS
ncbi:hypothetical protein EV122DRAFT_264161 [Schizophyllum commune]